MEKQAFLKTFKAVLAEEKDIFFYDGYMLDILNDISDKLDQCMNGQRSEEDFLANTCNILKSYHREKPYGIALAYGLGKYPANPAMASSRASDLAYEKNYQAAIDILRPAYDSGRGNGSLAYQLGCIYIRNNDGLNALNVLKPLYDAGYNKTGFLRHLATAHLLVHDVTATQNILAQIIAQGKPAASKADDVVKKYADRLPLADAIHLLKYVHDSGAGGMGTVNRLAVAYLLSNRPNAAINLLKPIYKLATDKEAIKQTLTDAYTKSGDAKSAAVLKNPSEMKKDDNESAVIVLATASVTAKDRSTFEYIKGHIEKKDIRDYLEAQLYFLENNTRKTMALLQPYMNKDFGEINPKVVTLFMACLTDENPILEFMKASMGKKSFKRLMIQRNEWLQSPARSDLLNIKMSNGAILFELGGAAVSTADRAKAGLGRETPVFATPGLWRN